MSPPVRRQRGGNQRRDPARRCRPVSEWPQTHQHAWTMAVRQGDRLNPGGPASQWAPRSKLKTEKGYGRFLTWLDLRGELDPESPPGTGVTPARIATFIDDLLGQGNTTYTALCRIQELYDALRSMAPTSSWRWFHDFAVELRDEVVTSEKKLEQIQHVDELLELGRSLMKEAESATKRTALRRAELFRDGLIVALLAARPMRIGNFTGVKIGGQVTGCGGGYLIVLRRAETKNRMRVEYEVPAVLVPMLERYVEHYRPILLSCGARYTPAVLDELWISREGSAMAERSMHQAIKRRTQAAFSVGVAPHRFRDAAATDFADKDPAHMLAASSVLANTPATMMKHYNQSRGLSAHRRYHAAIADLRAAPHDDD